MSVNTYLWEILVPGRKEGQKVKKGYHKQWDAKVRAISKGLTILSPTKGQWVDKDGSLFVEKMIPVRIACTQDEILDIATITAKHYNQKAVMYYKMSDNVHIRYYQ